MRKYIISGIFFVMVVLVGCVSVSGKERYNGIPDAINSFDSDGDMHLTVIANERNVKDKYALAREIIDMCRENSFQTIKFSYDIEYPKRLSIEVYETRKAFEKDEKLFHVDYKTEDFLQPYNIVENSDEYRLYVDGSEIDY